MDLGERLDEVLAESQRLGFLGSRPISEVIEHARVFVDALESVSGSIADLGAGGGVPGLVVAVDRPDLSVTMIDRRSKRTDFLERMVHRLKLVDRVDVITADVADVGRRRPGSFDAVVARGFGPPMSTLAFGAVLVRPGGLVVISEPPSGDRWDESQYRELGVQRRTQGRRVVTFERVT